MRDDVLIFMNEYEWMNEWICLTAGDGAEKAMLLFNMYDLDNSGSLSKDEFKTILRHGFLQYLIINK